ncbi:MAG TPA: FGGY-family carbohydrate kinase [Candidatus Limnocylindrales bacterium]|nr:FGGY-family carbohydrate kinase [Candidatus Limnocylindrales bacterium]
MSRRAGGSTGRGTVSAALGIDLGTTEAKVGVVGLDGRLLGLGRQPIEMALDQSTGRAEQDPEAWWLAIGEASREAMDAAEAAVGAAALDVIGVGLDGHGPTLVAVDADGRAVAPAITWQDARPASIAAELRAASGLGGWGLGIVPAVAWLEQHEPDRAHAARWYLNTWEALGLRLTGVAASTYLPGTTPNVGPAAAVAGLSADRFGDPIASGDVLGRLRADAAEHLGIGAGTPIVAGLVDAHASAHGARLLEPGDGLDVGGAAGGFGLYWDRPLQAAGSFTNPAPMPGLWLIGGAFAATGAALDWLRDGLLGGRWTTEQLIAEAGATEAGADGLVFLPYLAGERSPLWDPNARGAFVGLTFGHRRAHLTRAVLEASALAIRHLVSGIERAGAKVRVIRVAGGPARSETWNRIKADVLGLPVEVPAILETAMVGSAILAAAGVGAHPGLREAIEAMSRIERRIEPDPSVGERYGRQFRLYLAAHPALQAARAAADREREAVSA